MALIPDHYSVHIGSSILYHYNRRIAELITDHHCCYIKAFILASILDHYKDNVGALITDHYSGQEV